MNENRGSILADTLGITAREISKYELKKGDIFNTFIKTKECPAGENKRFVFESFASGGRVIKAQEEGTDSLGAVKIEYWSLRSVPDNVTVSGKKELVKIIPAKGEMFVWKGKKNECQMYKFIEINSKGNISCINPIDNVRWTLHTNTSYLPLSLFLTGKYTI